MRHLLYKNITEAVSGGRTGSPRPGSLVRVGTHTSPMSLRVQRSLLLLLHLLDVELELLAFEYVAVGSAGLPGSGSDTGEESTSGELVGDVLVDLSGGLSLLKGGKDVSALLDLTGSGSFALLLLLLAKFNIVVLKVELLERSGIDLNN